MDVVVNVVDVLVVVVLVRMVFVVAAALAVLNDATAHSYGVHVVADRHGLDDVLGGHHANRWEASTTLPNSGTVR